VHGDGQLVPPNLLRVLGLAALPAVFPPRSFSLSPFVQAIEDLLKSIHVASVSEQADSERERVELSSGAVVLRKSAVAVKTLAFPRRPVAEREDRLNVVHFRFASSFLLIRCRVFMAWRMVVSDAIG